MEIKFNVFKEAFGKIKPKESVPLNSSDTRFPVMVGKEEVGSVEEDIRRPNQMKTGETLIRDEGVVFLRDETLIAGKYVTRESAQAFADTAQQRVFSISIDMNVSPAFDTQSVQIEAIRGVISGHLLHDITLVGHGQSVSRVIEIAAQIEKENLPKMGKDTGVRIRAIILTNPVSLFKEEAKKNGPTSALFISARSVKAPIIIIDAQGENSEEIEKIFPNSNVGIVHLANRRNPNRSKYLKEMTEEALRMLKNEGDRKNDEGK